MCIVGVQSAVDLLRLQQRIDQLVLPQVVSMQRAPLLAADGRRVSQQALQQWWRGVGAYKAAARHKLHCDVGRAVARRRRRPCRRRQRLGSVRHLQLLGILLELPQTLYCVAVGTWARTRRSRAFDIRLQQRLGLWNAINSGVHSGGKVIRHLQARKGRCSRRCRRRIACSALGDAGRTPTNSHSFLGSQLQATVVCKYICTTAISFHS